MNLFLLKLKLIEITPQYQQPSQGAQQNQCSNINPYKLSLQLVNLIKTNEITIMY